MLIIQIIQIKYIISNKNNNKNIYNNKIYNYVNKINIKLNKINKHKYFYF